MGISIKEGSVYFLREQELVKNLPTEYLKIGFFGGERTAKQSASALQSGNPRQLVQICSVEAKAAPRLKSYLLQKFANKKLSANWFVMN